MSILSISFLIGFAASFLNFFNIIFFIGKFKKTSPILFHAASALLYFCAILVIKTLYPIDLWIAFSIFCFSCSLGLFAFGTVYKSITVRVFYKLYSEKNAITKDVITKDVIEPTFANRIEVLKSMRAIIENNMRFSLSDKGVRLVNIFDSIRRKFGVNTRATYCLPAEQSDEKVKLNSTGSEIGQ